MYLQKTVNMSEFEPALIDVVLFLCGLFHFLFSLEVIDVGIVVPLYLSGLTLL